MLLTFYLQHSANPIIHLPASFETRKCFVRQLSNSSRGFITGLKWKVILLLKSSPANINLLTLLRLPFQCIPACFSRFMMNTHRWKNKWGWIEDVTNIFSLPLLWPAHSILKKSLCTNTQIVYHLCSTELKTIGKGMWWSHVNMIKVE